MGYEPGRANPGDAGWIEPSPEVRQALLEEFNRQVRHSSLFVDLPKAEETSVSAFR